MCEEPSCVYTQRQTGQLEPSSIQSSSDCFNQSVHTLESSPWVSNISHHSFLLCKVPPLSSLHMFSGRTERHLINRAGKTFLALYPVNMETWLHYSPEKTPGSATNAKVLPLGHHHFPNDRIVWLLWLPLQEMWVRDGKMSLYFIQKKNIHALSKRIISVFSSNHTNFNNNINELG